MLLASFIMWIINIATSAYCNPVGSGWMLNSCTSCITPISLTVGTKMALLALVIRQKCNGSHAITIHRLLVMCEVHKESDKFSCLFLADCIGQASENYNPLRSQGSSRTFIFRTNESHSTLNECVWVQEDYECMVSGNHEKHENMWFHWSYYWCWHNSNRKAQTTASWCGVQPIGSLHLWSWTFNSDKAQYIFPKSHH